MFTIGKLDSKLLSAITSHGGDGGGGEGRSRQCASDSGAVRACVRACVSVTLWP